MEILWKMLILFIICWPVSPSARRPVGPSDFVKWLRCTMGGSFGASEIPRLSMSFYLFRKTATRISAGFWLKIVPIEWFDFARKTQSGGEFGWGGTSVKWQQRCPQVSSTRTEISCGPKGEKLAWFSFSVRIQTVKAWPIDPSGLRSPAARGVGKVSTGISGLWQPSVRSDVAFWSFDVGSSCRWDAEVAKCRIVQPPIGNVSWD